MKTFKHHHLQLVLFSLYIIFSTAILIKEGVGLTPDRYILVLLLGAVMLHKGIKFIHDFLPFIALWVAYDFLRGFADDINRMIDFTTPINITKAMFLGHIPTVDLQHRFFTLGSLHWWDYGASFFYMFHFAIPLIFAFVLWLTKRKEFIEFMVGLTLMSYGALLFYLIHPVAPPWLAAQQGYLPHVTKIFNVVVGNFPEVFHLPTLYSAIGSNLVAAIPSMHTAYSYLVFLAALRYFGKIGWWLLIYTVGMWLSIVYLGEHYVIDIIFGVIYATIFFKIAQIMVKKWDKYLELI